MRLVLLLALLGTQLPTGVVERARTVFESDVQDGHEVCVAQADGEPPWCVSVGLLRYFAASDDQWRRCLQAARLYDR